MSDSRLPFVQVQERCGEYQVRSKSLDLTSKSGCISSPSLGSLSHKMSVELNKSHNHHLQMLPVCQVLSKYFMSIKFNSRNKALR